MKHLKRQNLRILAVIILITSYVSSLSTVMAIESFKIPIWKVITSWIGIVVIILCLIKIVKNSMKTYNENIIKIKEYE